MVLSLLFSIFFVRETQAHVQQEEQLAAANLPQEQKPSFAEILLLTSWKDRALFSASQAGLINNLNDGVVWGLIPIFLVGAGLSLAQIGIVAAVYPGVWGISQLATGVLSDRWGRKGMIVAGMFVQAVGIGLFVIGKSYATWLAGATLLGLGTALVYPTLLAVISDVAAPSWRASAVGVYRLWRDGGYAVGALADFFNMTTAIAVVGGLTFLSGVIVAGVMYETLPEKRLKR